MMTKKHDLNRFGQEVLIHCVIPATVLRHSASRRREAGIQHIGNNSGFQIKSGMTLLPTFIILALSSLLPVSPLFAGEKTNAGQQPGDNEARFEATASRLNLSDEQKEKIKTLRQTQRQQMEALGQQLREKRQQVKSELNQPAATRESIAPLVAEIKDIQSKMVDLRINNIFAIKEMLNADQFSKLQQFHQQKTGERKGCRPFWLDMRRGNKENNEEKNQEP